jgi:hypothetical protein
MIDLLEYQYGINPDHKYHFHGVDGNCFKLDSIVYEAIEDGGDGYRSCLGSIETTDKYKLIFYRNTLTHVRLRKCEEDTGFTGFEFVDSTDHVWLKVGTDYSADYYPCFVFEYTPKIRE